MNSDDFLFNNNQIDTLRFGINRLTAWCEEETIGSLLTEAKRRLDRDKAFLLVGLAGVPSNFDSAYTPFECADYHALPRCGKTLKDEKQGVEELASTPPLRPFHMSLLKRSGRSV